MDDLTGIADALRALGFQDNVFGIGGVRDNATCLAQEESEWVVWFQENGRAYDRKKFLTLGEAIDELLLRLIRDPVSRVVPKEPERRYPNSRRTVKPLYPRR